MASSGHLLQQQKAIVESRIENLRNEDLKEICRANGTQVSGTKVVLLTRCRRVLNDIVSRGDVSAFEDFKRLGGIALDGLPELGQTPRNTYPSSGHQSHNMPSHRGGNFQLHPSRLPPDGEYFKTSPFYEVRQPLLSLQDLPEMPQNRHTVKSTFAIKPEIAQQFRSVDGANLKILLFCGLSHQMSPYTQTDVTFPNQIEVKVNDQDVKNHNFKGLKNKAGSTKPADITSYLRKFSGQDNTIQVTYALTQKRFAYAVYLVRSVSPDKLVERIKKGNIIPRDKVLHDMNKANADPDIAATSMRMSLKDPVSTMRITLPVRSSHCTHNQCFDGAMFLQLQEQAPQWSCPVCCKNVSFESLCVDKYFEDILNRTSKSIEQVDIEPNGDWKVIREEEDLQPNGTSSKARASYDDDFDDLIELDQTVNKPLNGVKRDSYSQTLSPFLDAPFSFDTPPLSSREQSVTQSASSAQRSSNKRPQSAVIDLTLSDDDDEPPRPSKRHSTIQSQRSQGTFSNSYNTPTSLPEPRYQPQQTNSTYNYDQTHAYRPSSTHGSNSYTPTNNFNTHNSMSPNPTSPFGQPTWPVQQHSRASAPQQHQSALFPPPNSPFSIRSASSVQNNSSGMHSNLRLPPMQPQQPSSSPDPNVYQGWRSDFDYGNYSSSPG